MCDEETNFDSDWGDASRPLASHLWHMKTSRIARASVDRVWPERDGNVSENVLGMSGVSSYAGIITIDADPLLRRDEGMLEMEATGEGDAIDHLPVAKLSVTVTMTGLGTIRLTRLPQPIEPSPSDY